jgi:hypothetical protein
MRKAILVVSLLIASTTTVPAQVSVGISFPGVSIGFNVPVYPELVPVPGYPVYYAPQLDSNYFFYDGMYWVYQNDNWYSSSWYNGPWVVVQPAVVPLFILRVPVRYYRQPPVYFRSWYADGPPRWGEHWGRSWEDHHRGWDRWNQAAVPAPAPLPVYQRQYSGDRYPQAQQQYVLQNQHYQYRPRDAVVQQNYRTVERTVTTTAPAAQTAPQATAPAPRTPPPQQMGRGEAQRPASTPAPQQAATPPARTPPPLQMGRAETPRPAPAPVPPQAKAPPMREPPRPMANGEVNRPPQSQPPPQARMQPQPTPQARAQPQPPSQPPPQARVQPQPQPREVQRTAAAPAPTPQAPRAAPPQPREQPQQRGGGEPRGQPGNGHAQQDKEGDKGGK